MAIYDDLQRLEEELLEEEAYWEEEEEAPSRHRKPSRAQRYAGERTLSESDALFVEKKKKRKAKGIRRLKFLAFLEILAIAGVLWWWITWLY